MLSRNSGERQNRFSIRKLSVGAASVLIGFAFMGMNGQTVKADEAGNGGSNEEASEPKKIEKTPHQQDAQGQLKFTKQPEILQTAHTQDAKSDGTVQLKVKGSDKSVSPDQLGANLTEDNGKNETINQEQASPTYKTTIVTSQDSDVTITPEYSSNQPKAGAKFKIIYDGFDVVRENKPSSFMTIDSKTGVLTLNTHNEKFNDTFDKVANIQIDYQDGSDSEYAHARIANIVRTATTTLTNPNTSEPDNAVRYDLIKNYLSLDDNGTEAEYSWDSSFDKNKHEQDTFVDVTIDGQTAKIPVHVVLTNIAPEHPARTVNIAIIDGPTVINYHKTSDNSGDGLVKDDETPHLYGFSIGDASLEGRDTAAKIVYEYDETDNLYHLDKSKTTDPYWTTTGQKAPDTLPASVVKVTWVKKPSTDVTNFETNDLEKRVEQRLNYTIPGQGTATSLASDQSNPTNPIKNVIAIQKVGDGRSIAKATVKISFTDGLNDIVGNPSPYNISSLASYNNFYGATAKPNMTVPDGAATKKKPEEFVDISDLTPEHNSEIAKKSDGSLDIVWADEDGTPDEDATLFGSSDDDNGIATATVRINFVDGSHLNVPVSAKIVPSMADQFKDQIKTKEIDISVGKDKNKINILDGIEDGEVKNNIDPGNSYFDDDELSSLDTSKPTEGKVPTYGANIQFKDGSSLAMDDNGNYLVKIPIKVVGGSQSQTQTAHFKYIDQKSGQEVPIVEAHEQEKAEGKAGQTVKVEKVSDKSFKVGDKTYTITDRNYIIADVNKNYTFTSGDQRIEIPVKKISMIDPSSDDATDDMFETITRTIHYTDPTSGFTYNPKKEVKYQRTKIIDEDGNTYKYGDWTLASESKSWPDFVVPEFDNYTVTAKDSNGNTVTISSNAEGKDIIAGATPDPNEPTNVDIYLTYKKSDRLQYDGKIFTKPIRTDQGVEVLPESFVDTDKTHVPEGTSYSYIKNADVYTPGTQEVTIIALYPDDTASKEITGKITVEATPQTQTITLKQGVAATADDAATGIKNLNPDGVDGMPKSVVWTTNAPSTRDAGTSTVNVTITYADGYQKTVNVPVNVLKTTHGIDEATKDPSSRDHDIYREVTRTITVDNGSPMVQKVVFTRDKYTDTTKDKNNVTYSDWVSDPTSSQFSETDNLQKAGFEVEFNNFDGSGIDNRIFRDNIGVPQIYTVGMRHKGAKQAELKKKEAELNKEVSNYKPEKANDKELDEVMEVVNNTMAILQDFMEKNKKD